MPAKNIRSSLAEQPTKKIPAELFAADFYENTELSHKDLRYPTTRINWHFRNYRKYPNREKLLELGNLALGGDKDAMWELALTCTFLAYAQARYFSKRILGRSLETEDLFSEALIGCFRAAQKYDPASGYMFTTYATHWIKSRIRRTLFDSDLAIRIPVHVRDLEARYWIERGKILKKGEPVPSLEDMAKLLGVKPEKLDSVLACVAVAKHITSLDEDISEDDDRPVGTFASDNGESVEEVFRNLNIMSLRRKVAYYLEWLPANEREVVRLRFGIDDDEYRTLEEVGQILDLTRERIRQIEASALERLRKLSSVQEVWSAENDSGE